MTLNRGEVPVMNVRMKSVDREGMVSIAQSARYAQEIFFDRSLANKISDCLFYFCLQILVRRMAVLGVGECELYICALGQIFVDRKFEEHPQQYGDRVFVFA